ncbi:Protein priB [Psilocybe cubensis]|uniref:Protein priB n=2 Tax=Psilocybe cubensis TaxID=181762 RepID=A0ACB8H7G1_PSICU|nr:Protein priB [Psilocybe cubensis]KAH9483811.1 Protein priB [Psilocybe cubensis]
MDPQLDAMNDQKPVTKTPVVRGARACTVCRTAKMKCVGAEDGQKQCQRCKRANVECVFEKHRRGRKPGSKLSEASKMLRRLEKGLNSAKMKSQSSDSTSPYHTDDLHPPPNQDTAYSPIRPSDPPYSSTSTHFPKNELSTPSIPPYQPLDAYPPPNNGSRPMDIDDEDEDPDRAEEAFFPAKLIRQENRNSFFGIILNPKPEEAPAAAPQRSNSFTPPQNTTPSPSGLSDPITAGIITDIEAKTLFDAIFLRLNPFINLFDPILHTVEYVRSKCPFLFTTLIMAGCKFFKAEKFKECQKLANEYTIRAFAESWKRVEVVQAFACLTYWKDPDDSRTWTYIGYACRMAVELGLNRYTPNPPPGETEFQKLERRNRQRTYLVLFVHDRSLSMQTGRIWMLPEDDLIRNCQNWHSEAGPSIRPEDAVITAFVSLRRIAAETTDIFNSSKSSHSDINHDMVLKTCNARLNQWDEHWRSEMQKVGGEKFHHSFLSFFRLHVRLFLNSFGLQPSMVHGSNVTPNVQALNACLTSAKQSLEIASQDFHSIHVLRYGQDSITVMTAYSAVFLLKLLRTNLINIDSDNLNVAEIHKLISQTADSYQDASLSSPVSISASYHARFLRSLVANDIFKTRHVQPSHSMPIDPRLQSSMSMQTSPAKMYSPQSGRVQDQPAVTHVVHTHPNFHFPASPHLPAHPTPTVVQQEHNDYAQHPQAQVPGRSPMTQSPPGGVVNPIHYPNSGPVSNGGNVGGNGNLSGGNHNLNGNGNGIGNGMSGMNNGYAPAVPPHSSDLDAHYWKNMFIELGFGDTVDPNSMPVGVTMVRGVPQYMDQQQQQQQQHHHHAQQQHQHHQQEHEQQHHQQNLMPHQQSHHMQAQMQYHIHQPQYGH